VARAAVASQVQPPVRKAIAPAPPAVPMRKPAAATADSKDEWEEF
jgi:hypothetical protein